MSFTILLQILYVLNLIFKGNMYLISHILSFIILPLYILRTQGKYLCNERLKSVTSMCDRLNICRRFAKIIHWVMVLTTLYSIYNNLLNKGFLASTLNIVKITKKFQNKNFKFSNKTIFSNKMVVIFKGPFLGI